MNEAVEMQGTPNHSTLGQPSHRKWKQRIKDYPCTQGFGGKLSSKVARSRKASRIGQDGFKPKTGLPRASPWLGADRETSSFSHWYKMAEERCIMPVQSSPWSVVRESHQARVIREAAGGRGERGQVQRDSLGLRQGWFSVFSAVPLPEMYIAPSNRSRIQSEMKGLRLDEITRLVEQQVCVPAVSIQLFILWRYR